MAEALNGTFKAELIHRRTWRTRDQVEYAIVEWIGWYNHRRLHSAIGAPSASLTSQMLPMVHTKGLATGTILAS